ncbi:MAG: M56 family metallopeptidase [Alteraurantiacibacter sp.]
MNGTGLSDWMVDTFVYTSALIALVLVLRRPVTRWFGPQIAYALWALPFLRFIMPPIVLPSWMGPAQAETATSAAAPLMVIISDPAEKTAVAEAATAPLVGIAVSDVLLPLWIGGALVFIGWRIREYVQMRRYVLAGSIPVGDAGKVRLVETPAVSSPIAFGIVDKVVALPPAFMALYDIKARDMAIAHELAHHRGQDLVANIAAQPLLALHWFNPLAWWGWRAMRRDQEAACDARVVAGCARSERAVYAEVIAGFAAGEHLTLAAPMACPVLGEKSIIHRLRSLTMTEVSSRRRRIGIAAITTTALALPLTASITYAKGEAPLPPQAPTAPNAPEAPIAPEAPLAPESPLSPAPPVPPSAAMMDGEQERVIVHVNDETGERRVVRHWITQNSSGRTEAGIDAAMAQFEAEQERREARIERRQAEIERHVMAAQQRARHSAQSAAHASALAAHSRNESAQARAAAVRFESVDCEGVDASGVLERDLADGRKVTIVCEADSQERFAQEAARLSLQAAMVGLRAAMDSIANNEMIPASERREAVNGMRDAIEELEEETRNMRRSRAKLDSLPGTGPNPRTSAVAMHRLGRMVSPVQARTAVRMTIPAPAQAADDDCEQKTVSNVRATLA